MLLCDECGSDLVSRGKIKPSSVADIPKNPGTGAAYYRRGSCERCRKVADCAVRPDVNGDPDWTEAAMTEARGTLANALAIGRRPEQQIGQVVGEITAGYKIGDFVIVRIYENEKTCTVEMPMSPGMIAREVARGSLLNTWLTIVGVPVDRIRIVL